MKIKFHMTNGHIWEGTERELKSNFTLQPWDRHTIKRTVAALRKADLGVSVVHFKDGSRLEIIE